MRITKKWLRNAKQRITERLENLCHLSDEWLLAEVKKLCGVEVSSKTSRKELIHYAIKWTIEDEIPSHLVD